jgi:hypothetical protein
LRFLPILGKKWRFRQKEVLLSKKLQKLAVA